MRPAPALSGSPGQWAAKAPPPKFAPGDEVLGKMGQDEVTGALQTFVNFEPAIVRGYDADHAMHVLVYDDETDREQHCPASKVKKTKAK